MPLAREGPLSTFLTAEGGAFIPFDDIQPSREAAAGTSGRALFVAVPVIGTGWPRSDRMPNLQMPNAWNLAKIKNMCCPCAAVLRSYERTGHCLDGRKH
jgi:hypothetical protein